MIMQVEEKSSRQVEERNEALIDKDGEDEADDDIAQSHQGKWESMFKRLLAFKRETGHCLVPNRYKKDHRLGSWVSTQRRQYKAFAAGKINTTTLSMDRIRKLESIGFAWSTDDPRRVDWYVRFKQLCIFQKEWGHTLVPMGYKKNPSLGNWVSVQRQEFRNLQQGKSSKMTPNRVKLLDSIGFIWKAPRGARRKNEKSPLASSLESEEGGLFSSTGLVAAAAGPASANFSKQNLESLRNINPELAALQSQQLPPSLYSQLGAAAASSMLPSTRSLLLQRAALRYKSEVLHLLDPQLPLLDDQNSSVSADDLSTVAALKLAAGPMQQSAFLGNSSLLGSTAGATSGAPVSLPSAPIEDSERLKQLLLLNQLR